MLKVESSFDRSLFVFYAMAFLLLLIYFSAVMWISVMHTDNQINGRLYCFKFEIQPVNHIVFITAS